MTVSMFKSAIRPTWCPGCGNYAVFMATLQAYAEMDWKPEDVVTVSGIGCSSRFPFFLSTYGFHSIHGRALPVATGIKTARPELKVVVVGGDGDGFAIGGGHFLHAARRNIDLTYIIMNNRIYGLTKGQTSPTSMRAFKTRSTPYGNLELPLNPVPTALLAGATYVARGFSGDPKALKEIILNGLRHRGFSLIDVLSPCVTYNRIDTFKTFKDQSTEIPEGHDPSNILAAFALARHGEKYYLGRFYQETELVLEDRFEEMKGPERPWNEVIDEIFDSMS